VKWITRSAPTTVQIACPWLIRRFVDPNAVFLFVTPSEVQAVAERFGAVPFDIEGEGVFWSHRGERCTFDVMIEEFGLSTPALDRLAMTTAVGSCAASSFAKLGPLKNVRCGCAAAGSSSFKTSSMNISDSFSIPFVALTMGTSRDRCGAALRATSRVAWLGATKTTIDAAGFVPWIFEMS